MGTTAETATEEDLKGELFTDSDEDVRSDQNQKKSETSSSTHGDNNDDGDSDGEKMAEAGNCKGVSKIEHATAEDVEEGELFSSAAAAIRNEQARKKEMDDMRTAAAKPSPITTNVYLPPFRRRQLEQQQQEERKENQNQNQNRAKNVHEGDHRETPKKEQPTPQIQRQKWEELKKNINGTINRLNATTIKPLIHSLFQSANLIRGKGLLVKAILRAATTSPVYASVYVALLSVINTKLPEVGELALLRAILTFRKAYARKDKGLTMSITSFMGHLFNQGLCHELLCLQILTVLLEGDPTDDSVEVAVKFTKVVGVSLLESSPAGVHAIMERFRNLLHDGTIGRRVQYKVEELMKERRKRFEMYPSVLDELDLVERDDQIMFEIGLDDEDLKKEEGLDVFRFDDEWNENEESWVEIQKEILGDDDDSSGEDGSGEEETDDDSGSGSEDGDGDDEDDEDGVLPEEKPLSTSANTKQITVIHDLSEEDLVHLRRTIYLTIMSSATFEECAHKLTKVDIPMGKEMELINMIIECCSQERTFLRYYGLISSRFCLLHDRWKQAFEQSFGAQYETIHRLETNKLRNVAKLFAHLLHTDALPWSCLSVIHLNEDETTSSSRIFLKILVQEMAGAMGIATLVKRFETKDPEAMEWYKELFPKDNPRKTRYAINFFTSIGLGPLTDGLREYLKNAPKLIMMQAEAAAKKAAEEKALQADSESDSDDSSTVSSSSASTMSSSSVSSSSVSSYTSYSSSSSGSSYSSYSSDESSVSRKKKKGKSRDKKSEAKDRNGKSTSKRRKRSSSVSSSSSQSLFSKDSKSSYSSRGEKDEKRKKLKRKRSRSRSNSKTIPSEIGGDSGETNNKKDGTSKKKSKRSRSNSYSSASTTSRRKKKRSGRRR